MEKSVPGEADGRESGRSLMRLVNNCGEKLKVNVRRFGGVIRQEKDIVWLMAAAVLLVVCVSGFKYRSGGINYYNSDATWHTLLTIEAYNETPASEHLFLPIVSLGDQDDKYIPWGAAVSGENGNYYYTSFSPAGYFLPWLFLKIFRLPVTEQSLYLFNTVLFALSAMLWTGLVYMVFRREKGISASVIAMTGMLTYIFSPEIFHGMGIVYWHQSLMQVTLLVQTIAYYKMLESGGKKAKILFYLTAFVNPYIEWTGYVANIGFALAELIRYRKKGIGKCCIIGIITIASFASFTLHYLLRVDIQVFMETLKYRFMARNVTTDVSLTDVFAGYLQSFSYLWFLLLCVMIWNLARYKKLEIRHGMLLFVLIFPVLENIIMKEHAVSYTYDRMKFVYFLSFLICELSCCLLSAVSHHKTGVSAGVMVVTIMACGLNLKTYKENDAYIWKVDYRDDNQKFAECVNQNYRDSMLAINGWGIRGYINLVFGRGIYEGTDAETLKQIAVSRGKKYAIIIHFADEWSVYDKDWGMYKILGADIYDTNSGDMCQISSETIKN